MKQLVFFVLFFALHLVYAQEIILSESFSKSRIPVDWKRESKPGASGWIFGKDLGWPIPAHNSYAASKENEEYDSDFSDDRLLTPVINCKDHINLILKFETFNPGVNGSTAHIYAKNENSNWRIIENVPFDETNWFTVSLSLSDFDNSEELQIAFVHSDNGSWATCFAIDNIEISGTKLLEKDLALNRIESPSGSCIISEQEISFSVKSLGKTKIPGFSAVYLLDNQEIYTAHFENDLESGETNSFKFPEKIIIPEGIHVHAIQLRNIRDDKAMNNIIEPETIVFPIIKNFPFKENFEDGESQFFSGDAGSEASIKTEIVEETNCLVLIGGTFNYWTGEGETTTERNAWEINAEHQATYSTVCTVDATEAESLFLSFSLKQTASNSLKYSWFRVLVDGTVVPSLAGVFNHNPKTQQSDKFRTEVYDLSKFAGKKFYLSFQASNKYFEYDKVFIDDIVLSKELN